jgi:hypothetical protein
MSALKVDSGGRAPFSEALFPLVNELDSSDLQEVV